MRKISFILRQFRTPHFLSFAFLIQTESEEMVFIRIISPEVIFPTQNESAQSDSCSSRYLQKTETCAADAKEAPIISNLLLIGFHPSAASSTNPSSNHIICKRSFTKKLSEKVIWSIGLFPSLRIHHQISFVNFEPRTSYPLRFLYKQNMKK